MIARVATTAESSPAIVVTGANGFLAQHCVDGLLSHGYRVIGTVRDRSKLEIVKSTHGDHANLEVVLVPDITDAGKLEHALASYSPEAVMHLAAPFNYSAECFEDELMRPAIEGTRAVLKAMENIPSVKRVIYTSSFASIFDANATPNQGKVYTAEDWSPLTYEDGVQAKTVPEAYRASKAASEKAAWEFMETRKPEFDLVSLCPAMVFGAFLPHSVPKRIEDLNTSNSLIWNALKGGDDRKIPPTRAPVWVDIRDVALAHVRALTVPAAGGRRFLLAAGTYSNQELVDLSRERMPKLRDRMAVGETGRKEAAPYGADATETERVLGITWRGLGDCLEQVVPQLFEIAALEKSS